MDMTLARMIDANANRAREALRLLEDFARFGLNDPLTSGELKALRHALAAALQRLDPDQTILARDTAADVGTAIKTPAEFQRQDIGDLVIAAGKRLSEALRVLEECAKTHDRPAAETLEKARYQGYILEQRLRRAAQPASRMADVRLYVLLTESLCRRPWEETLAEVLKGGAQCVQLREKELDGSELLRRARILVGHCRAAGALAVINDRPDIALLADADGVHLGQQDLPCAEVRRLMGSRAIIGVSTERLEEARKALGDGASYVGAGPMFWTQTKHKPRLAGPAYAAEVARELPLPAVAIGGISLENLPQVCQSGISGVAICSAIISQDDPAQACRRFLEAIVSHDPQGRL